MINVHLTSWGLLLSTALALWLGHVCADGCTGRPSRVSTRQTWGWSGVEEPIWGDVHYLSIWLTLSLNERRSSAEAGKVGDVAQVLWVSGRSGWRKGKGEEYCLEFGQVLLEHVTNFESTGRDIWAPSYSFSLDGAAPAQGQARWSQVVVLVSRWCVCGGGRPSLGNNRWFTKKYQGDASIKKERCVYSMISTDQMHIHRMKVTPVNDSRVWPTLRRQRHGVEWVLMERVTSPRAPIIKLKKKKEGAAGW